jgi:hypothetical protein
MKTELTEKWENTWGSYTSCAKFGCIYLQCEELSNDRTKLWVGIAYIPYLNERIGPHRKSIREARRDAERLAVELLRDIRDGAKALMTEFDMGEDD